MNAELIGVCSGLMGLACSVPYCIRTWRKEIQPNPTGWFLWALQSTILLITYRGAGAGESVWLAVAGAANPIIIFSIALIRQHSGWRKPDKFESATLAMGIVATVFLAIGRAEVGLVVAIVADLPAFASIFRQAWRDPSSDRPLPWILFAAASVVAMFSITERNLVNYTLPVYYFLTEALVAVPLMLYRRKMNIRGEWI